jgi:hypothetical protein
MGSAPVSVVGQFVIVKLRGIGSSASTDPQPVTAPSVHSRCVSSPLSSPMPRPEMHGR